MYIMNYMELSTLHIKAPHAVHIAAKVLALQNSTSMNQYVINLIKADMERNKMDTETLEEGINLARAFKNTTFKDELEEEVGESWVVRENLSMGERYDNGESYESMGYQYDRASGQIADANGELVKGKVDKNGKITEIL